MSCSPILDHLAGGDPAFRRQGGRCATDAIKTVRDVDGDGRTEAVITEGSIACFGQSEVGYSLVSKQPNGNWKLITGGEGIAHFLPRREATGWPDLEIGGPGFCFPVQRWNGREYALNRHQYRGKPCRPPR